MAEARLRWQHLRVHGAFRVELDIRLLQVTEDKIDTPNEQEDIIDGANTDCFEDGEENTEVRIARVPYRIFSNNRNRD